MSAGINYADVQALVQRAVNRGLLKRGAPMTPVAASELPSRQYGTWRHIPEPVWAAVDWALDNKAIASQVGVPRDTVNYQRRRRAPETVRRRTRGSAPASVAPSTGGSR